jgi:hypothetical protein
MYVGTADEGDSRDADLLADEPKDGVLGLPSLCMHDRNHLLEYRKVINPVQLCIEVVEGHCDRIDKSIDSISASPNLCRLLVVIVQVMTSYDFMKVTIYGVGPAFAWQVCIDALYTLSIVLVDTTHHTHIYSGHHVCDC